MDNYQKQIIAGVCFFDRVSTPHQASLVLVNGNNPCGDEWQIRVHDDNGEETYRHTLDLNTLKISEPLANLPRNIYFDNHCFTIAAGDLPKELCQLNQHEKKWQFISMIEQRWRWVLLSMGVLIASFVLFIEIGIPALAKPIAKMVPIEWKQALDDQTMDYLKGYSYLKGAEIKDAQHRLEKLASNIPQSEEVIEKIMVFKASDLIGANAFALPGGTVLFTQQMLDIGLKDNEILAILAHEMGHVKQNHSMRSVVQNMSLVILIGAYLGDVSFFSNLLLVSAPTLAQNAKYSRDFERQADNFAIGILKQLNIPSSCLGTGLAKLEVYNGEMVYLDEIESAEDEASTKSKKEKAIDALVEMLSTHPSTAERIKVSNSQPCV